MSYSVVSLFSGAGGLDMGFFNKGFNILWANDIDKDACKTHSLWAPKTTMINENIKKIDLNTIPNSDVIIGGFPCLTGDSLVLTNKGYKKIIDIKIGDMVLSHDNKYHKVLNFFNQGFKSIYKLYTNEFNYIKATNNHKFFVRKKNDKPFWASIQYLEDLIRYDTYYIGSSINQNENYLENKYNESFWYNIGINYLKEIKSIQDIEIRTFIEENILDYYLINLPINLLRYFVRGVLLNNEKFENNRIYLKFNNLSQTYLILHCLQKIYKKTFLVDTDNNILYLDELNDDESFFENDIIWNKITKIEDLQQNELVYDIEVEDSHSFVVNNMISHNCQGFSLAGPRKIDDSRNSLYKFFVDLVELKQPKIFLAENVKGILTLGDGEIIEAIKEDFKSKGYKIYIRLFNVSDYGVPQDRERVIIIGIRNDISEEFKFPEKIEKKVTLKECLKDIKFQEEDVCKDAYSSRFMSRNRIRHWDEQSFTIPAMAKQVPLHPSSPNMIKINKDKWEFGIGTTRRLSYKECAAIQTFPKDMIFEGNLNSKYKQIGNAVPVKFAESLASSIKVFLNKL